MRRSLEEHGPAVGALGAVDVAAQNDPIAHARLDVGFGHQRD
jgi:hypothetical protein